MSIARVFFHLTRTADERMTKYFPDESYDRGEPVKS